MTRAHFVKKARKDYPEANIKRGESYYWWKFNFSRTVHRSKTAPKRSQLTQSDFLATIYGIEDTISNLNTEGDLEDEVQSIISELECLRDECEDRLSNMPDQLQEGSSSGQLLQERTEYIDEMISELESAETELDEDGIREEAIEYKERELNKKFAEFTESEKEELEKLIENKVEEKKQEILEEIQNVSYNGG